jgi:hypothetical protein
VVVAISEVLEMSGTEGIQNLAVAYDETGYSVAYKQLSVSRK